MQTWVPAFAGTTAQKGAGESTSGQKEKIECPTKKKKSAPSKA
jgi:hypothetical protein